MSESDQIKQVKYLFLSQLEQYVDHLQVQKDHKSAQKVQGSKTL